MDKNKRKWCPDYLISGDGTFWGGVGFGLGSIVHITKEFKINLRADGETRTITIPVNFYMAFSRNT